MRGLVIREDDLTGPEIRRLLREHLENMHDITPPGSVHALGLDGLQSPGVTFWSAWRGQKLVGCAALRKLDATSGEIKSMRTVNCHRRMGVGSSLLEHLVAVACQRGYDRLLLETGALPEFATARAFYARHGFARCGPFGDYRDDPNSAFMCRDLP